MPSGTQMFITDGVPSCLPKYSLTLRLAWQWAIQKSRTALSGWLSVSPSSLKRCEKQVGLKSRPMPAFLAHSTQLWKWWGSIASRETGLSVSR
ncbi:hypothetical protein D3C87_1809080 [compost metagenome]